MSTKQKLKIKDLITSDEQGQEVSLVDVRKETKQSAGWWGAASHPISHYVR